MNTLCTLLIWENKIDFMNTTKNNVKSFVLFSRTLIEILVFKPLITIESMTIFVTDQIFFYIF